MITLEQLAQAFERNATIVQMQAKGLTHEDSLRQLPFRGNCFNWIVGHMLASRDDILSWLGEEPVGGDRAARYRRESDPVVADGDGVVPFDELLSLLAASQERLGKAIPALAESDLQREVLLGTRAAPLGSRLFFLYFHDTYHTGQAEILRQSAGVDDKVI
jgi:uncharacterized damage-inducible protein DinB